jgi:LacI family transcriptional regulator
MQKSAKFPRQSDRKGGTMKKVTIQDVARELNLSRNTVARALNNSETVAYETRYMVIEKACEMGYLKVSPSVLNEFRLHGDRGEPKTILVIARREISVFWNSIIMGISDLLNQNGCRLRFDFVSEEDERKLVLPPDFREEVDGIILISVFSLEYLEEILKKELPTVCLDFPASLDKTEYPVDVVVSEGMESVRAITKQLVRQGLTRIGFVGDISYCRTIRDRYVGYTAGLAECGVKPQEDAVATAHLPGRYYMPEDIEAYLNGLSHMPEAIVCANDAIAFLVVKALRKRGIAVPKDVAVTGFDNQEEIAKMDAFLTTVRVGNTRLGKRLACQLLFRMQHTELPPEVVTVDTKVVYRESSEKYVDGR